MTLPAGTRLGPYEILSPLGAGGMGEVYKAKDTRLDRTVAVKVLPSHLSDNPELKARFEREAKAISHLTHPHICTLHDVGSENGVDFLVMELLEGQTLADRLEKGPLATDQVLKFGVEIADALDRAHRAGIVHRDLKPGNIMLTKSGVKLLDFGLAKVAAASEPSSDLSSLPTQAASQPLTEKGTVMGTFQYMAPEQLEGKEADSRTDIFSFGCVLYEMATGRKAFTGASQASLITAILSKEPEPISAISPMTPPSLDRLVKTCLAKDPEDRWQSARDVKNELAWIAQAGSQAGAPAVVVTRRRSREKLAWAASALLLIAAAAAIVAAARSAKRAALLDQSVRTSVVLPEKTAVRGVALSPDGRRLAFVARDSTGQSLLWVRALDSFTVQPLPGTENPSFPFWSPDSRYVAFFSEGKLKKIDASGGPPQAICEAPEGRGASWSREGVIVLAPVVDGPLFRVPASGGVATQLTKLDPKRGETSHRWPFFLPDGRHFFYLVANFASPGNVAGMGIYVRALDSESESLVSPVRSSMEFVSADGGSAGSLLFFKDGNLMAQSFDGRAVAGEPAPIAEEIQYFPQTQYALFSASQNRTLVYLARAASGVSQLEWLDRSGKLTGTLGPPANQANPRISPDGTRVALDITDPQSGNTDVWIYQASGGVPTRFTSHPAIDSGAIWSPDGTRLVFQSLRLGHADLYRKGSNGVGQDELILVDARTKYPTDWSPDGRSILFRAIDEKTNFELWTLPAAGERKPALYLKNTFGFSHAQFSPDGYWVAYASNESGKWEIYVSPYPGPGGNWKISSAGGSEPRWRRDGRELFYLSPDGKMMAVAVKEGPPFEASAATPLFQTRRRERISATDLFSYDVSADGQRFLVNTDVGEVASSPLNLVLNWAADTK
jgi:Tol biopolymer transport system component/tRNA A-37 threonylcarbamoyl transferase component Bud32